VTRRGLLVATLVAVLGTSACGLFESNNGGGGGGGVPRSTPTTDSSTPGPTKPKPSDPGETAKGYAEVAYGGSDKVDCGAISAQVKLTAHDGKAAWTARAQLGDSFVANTPASGVRVSPASGTIDNGRSSTIQVTGTFDKAAKVFYVMVVSRDGSTGKAVKFTCR
jgi:hypothetical protein